MTTRRNVVTGLLAAGTLPVAAIAAPGTVDPIFAAIEAANEANAKKTRHDSLRTDFEATLPDEVTRCQRVLVGRNGDGPIYVYMHQHIDEFFVRHASLSLPALDCDQKLKSLWKAEYAAAHYDGRARAIVEQFHAELPIAKARAHKELDRDHKRMMRVQESSGLMAMKNESCELFDLACDTDLSVRECHPTTPLGVAAKINYMLEKMRDGSFGDDEMVHESLEHLRKSLSMMAVTA